MLEIGDTGPFVPYLTTCHVTPRGIYLFMIYDLVLFRSMPFKVFTILLVCSWVGQFNFQWGIFSYFLLGNKTPLKRSNNVYFILGVSVGHPSSSSDVRPS